MIYYIKNEINGGVSYPEKKVMARSALGAINLLCKENLFTLEGYLKTTREILGIKYKTPIVISDFKVFFYTKSLKSYDNIFINFVAIDKSEKVDEYTRLTFEDEVLDLDLKYNEFIRISKHIFKILKYRESLV